MERGFALFPRCQPGASTLRHGGVIVTRARGPAHS